MTSKNSPFRMKDSKVSIYWHYFFTVYNRRILEYLNLLSNKIIVFETVKNQWFQLVQFQLYRLQMFKHKGVQFQLHITCKFLATLQNCYYIIKYHILFYSQSICQSIYSPRYSVVTLKVRHFTVKNFNPQDYTVCKQTVAFRHYRIMSFSTYTLITKLSVYFFREWLFYLNI